MNENTTLSCSVYMSSILSPGWSHKCLPSAVRSQRIFALRGRCPWITYGNTDRLDWNGTCRIRIYSHNAIYTVNLKGIRSFINIGKIVDSVSILIKVIFLAVDPFGFVCHIALFVRINIANQVLWVIYDYPSSCIFTGGIHITVSASPLYKLIGNQIIASEAIPVSIHLAPAVSKQCSIGICIIGLILVAKHLILNQLAISGSWSWRLEEVFLSFYINETSRKSSVYSEITAFPPNIWPVISVCVKPKPAIKSSIW